LTLLSYTFFLKADFCFDDDDEVGFLFGGGLGLPEDELPVELGLGGGRNFLSQ
jgi:hypothetical protein